MQQRTVTAKVLFQKSGREIIKNIVRDQVRLIDAKIMMAHEAGFDVVDYSLPVTFDINNLDVADAQTMVYSELLLIYKSPEPTGKGFENVQIDMVNKVLRVRWMNGMTEGEREYRNDIIKKNLAGMGSERKQLPKF